MIPLTQTTILTRSASEGITRRWRFGLVAALLTAFCVGGAFSADQDPVKNADDPPLRLKKKNKSEQPAPAEKKTETPSRKLEPEKKTGEPKGAAEPDAKELEEKIKELTGRIDRNMREANDRLAKKDTGDVTQQIEREIVKDLDDLLEQSQRQQQQQQQQQQNQQNQSQSQDQNSQSKQGNSSSARQQAQRRRQQARAERARRRRQSGQAQLPSPQQPQDQQQSGGARGGNSPRGDMSKIADLYKDIWGHLPETLRQEMNQYSREQFMAKYNDLLKQYYSTIAEKGRQKKDGN